MREGDFAAGGPKARELADVEGCDASRLQWVLSDAHGCGGQEGHLVPGSYDAIVMHTLLSHTSDPAAVLREASRLAAPGALLVVMDGDYWSLTYADLDEPELGRRMDAALVRCGLGSAGPSALGPNRSARSGQTTL